MSPDAVIEQDKSLRMYVLVVKERLTTIQVGIQAAHACLEFANAFYNTNSNFRQWITKDKTLIILEATEKQIKEMNEYFKRSDKRFTEFYEPDLLDDHGGFVPSVVEEKQPDGVLTACAYEPMSNEDGKIVFGKFRLA